MKIEETRIPDCYIFEPQVFEDERGYFFEGFNSNSLKKYIGYNFEVKQINQSKSSKGVLRGLHFQNENKAQAKIVSCVHGEVLDIAVDIRPNSATFGKYALIRLSSDNKKHFFIPKGMAHGFLVYSEYAIVVYQVDEWYSPTHDTGIVYNDPFLNIPWGMSGEKIIVSTKDKNLPSFNELKV